MEYLPTFASFENFSDTLGISLEIQVQRVKAYFPGMARWLPFILSPKMTIFMRRELYNGSYKL